ncbi:MAG: hypothetical protein L3J18_06790 [Candidatus Brocadia sp.]|nr:MAG: hypothetical protein L3J18_06790 [Candidatus Brocadia sp.]
MIFYKNNFHAIIEIEYRCLLCFLKQGGDAIVVTPGITEVTAYPEGEENGQHKRYYSIAV